MNHEKELLRGLWVGCRSLEFRVAGIVQVPPRQRAPNLREVDTTVDDINPALPIVKNIP